MRPTLLTRFLLALLVLAAPAVARAASPVLGGVTPRGGQRGSETILLLNGARLGDALEVLFYSPGLQASRPEVVNDNQVRVTVKIAPDCRLGEHALRLRCSSGLSELRTFWVGALPVVAEKEPNSDFNTPQRIPLNVTVAGVVDNEDVDYFAVECKKGQRLSAEVEGMRLGGTLFDPHVAILDSKRFELATSDDAPLLGQDATASILCPADGTYVVQVRESAYGGNGGCAYRLHVGTFPRPLAMVPAGGKAGEEVEVRLIGDPAGEIRQKVAVPARAGDKLGVFAQDAGGVSPSPLPFRVSEVGNVLEVEPNDTPATATPATLPLALNGVIDRPGDVDHFRFRAARGQTFDVHCYARRLGSPLDSVMTLSALNGGALASNDDAVGPDSYFRVTFPADGEYVLAITDHLGKGGPTYFYRVEFTEVKPEAVVSVPKVAQYSQERQAIVVPRGNRMATLVSVARANFGGEVILGADGLPPGVTFQAENVAANLDVVPVVFEAAPTAAPAASLIPFTARHADPKHPAITSRFQQTAELILGGPGQSVYWKVDVNRAAVAVADEAPFSVSIVEPKAPLVQNGSLGLEVVAQRKPGFNAPITIVPLFNPPGVSSASSVVIPAGALKAVLPMNAAGNAQVRKWKTAVLATSDAGKGPLWVSSQLATIEVAPPFVAFTMEKVAAEQGKGTDLLCKIQQLTPFDGPAQVKLLGLPFKVTAADQQITRDSKEVLFKLTVDATSPPGVHRNLFCQVVVTKAGEPVVASTGGSELRIDVPIVKATPPPPPPPAVKGPVTPPPPPPAKPPEKRLTRLEKLRLEQEEREKAGKGEAPKP